MSKRHENDLQAELGAIRQKLAELEAKQYNDQSTTTSICRWSFLKVQRFGLFPMIGGLLLVSTVLYAQGINPIALFIDKLGNVGIGTDKPDAKLDVGGKVKAKELVIKENANINGKVGIGTDRPDAKLDVDGQVKAKELVIKENANINGKVGIGTNEPKQALHVNGDYYGKGHLWLYGYNGDRESGVAYVQARDDSGTSDIALQLRTQKTGIFVDALHINSDGNVGIGKIVPTVKLDVQGGIKATSIKIGETEISENELKILKKLARGQLKVRLFNTSHQEYMYAANDGFAYDNDRRRVFTWRKKQYVTQGEWQLQLPR